LLLGGATLIFVYNVWKTARTGEMSEKNPWGAATLEWAISSPPPAYNFSVIPEVSSRLPLWVEGGVSEIPDEPPGPVHLPAGSYWPPVSAVGLVLIFTAALTHTLWLAFVGAGILVFSVFKWVFEPFEV
jgi:heme/copper-type cytochrome/quinol oxidase subunit 1